MSKHDLTLEPPLMNAAGSLGFAPDLHSPLDWSRLGAFVTNPISLLPRTPARGQRFATYPGGFLLHTGYPNPGLARSIQRFARQWSGASIPVIVHLLARGVDEVVKMTRHLEQVDGVTGLELSLPVDATGELVKAFVEAAGGELPLIVRLPVERSLELAAGAIQAGASAISLGPPRGAFPSPDGELVQGRMYGPALLPLSLRVVQVLSRQGIPTIGSGGVYKQEHIDAMLGAGALAVQLDSIFWKEAGYNPITQRS